MSRSGPAHIVGRYAVYDEIAAGGMATVHISRLLGPVGFSRTVAIKRLHPQFAKDPEFVAMFLDEARIAARICHPNVVATLDIVATEGELFLVMEYVHGESLARLRELASRRGESVPTRIVTSILCGVLHGLHAAHEARSDQGEALGIVHRDVSPQNVLVGLDGVARVLDFGVAKALGRSHATRDGRVKGKLAYMAPEQLRGKVTRKTDVFAASVVLWELLTGERLFAGDDDAAVVGSVLNRTIAPPSKLRRWYDEPDPAVRVGLERLDDVTLRGLERDPARRFDSAREMALALEQCVGVASPTEVGQWVECVAGHSLQQRARKVLAVESGSPTPRATFPSSAGSGSSADGNPIATGASALHDEAISELSTISVARPVPPSATRRRLGIWAGAGLVGLASVALALLRTSAPPAPSEPPAQSSVTSQSVGATSIASAPEPSARSAVAPEPASSAEVKAASPGPTRARTAAPPRRGAARRPPAVKPGCDPPYALDAAGHKHFKEECFRP
jgi:serine/threonine-protein kinase